MEGVSVAELIKHLLVGSIQPQWQIDNYPGMAHQIKEQGLTTPTVPIGCFTTGPLRRWMKIYWPNFATTRQLPPAHPKPRNGPQRIQGKDPNDYLSISGSIQVKGGDPLFSKDRAFRRR